MSRQSITNNSLLIKSSLMMRTWHAWDELRSDQSSSPFSPHDISVFLVRQLPPCACAVVCLRPCEDAAMTAYAASPLLMPPLATLCPLNALGLRRSLCSILRHMVTLLSIHSQRLISASLEVRTCHLSKKKKKLITAVRLDTFFFQKLEKHFKY